MRDILVAVLIFGSLPATLVWPYIGIIMWSLVSYMNIHRMTWGFMYYQPVGMYVAITTIIAWLISGENKRIPFTALTFFTLLLLAWTGITTIFAIEQEMAWGQFDRFFKVIAMAMIGIAIMHTRQRLHLLVWVTVVSIGYFAIKGGAFTIVTGGYFRVWGPPLTMITDNNDLALATMMIIPLMVYLARVHTNILIKMGLYVAVLLALASVIGSYSRGGFLTMAVITLVLWWRSSKRFLMLLVSVVLIASTIPLIPQKWYDRMDSISNYEQDDSATGRLDMWGMAIDIAQRRPIVGGGFDVHRTDWAYENSPGITRRNFHSIYFSVLGWHGYVGLAIFLALGLIAFRNAKWIKKKCRGNPDLSQEYALADMIQISLIAFATGGAFLNFAFYDLYYGLIAMLIITRALVEKKLAEPVEAPAPTESGKLSSPAPQTSFLRRRLQN
jgi:probable O-glycosylation ligase (exosortase A-associated)